MSKQAAKLAAIHAPKIYVEYGTGPHQGATREILIGLSLGVAAGFMWKTWHWGEKKKIKKYYEELEKIYAQEDAEV